MSKRKKAAADLFEWLDEIKALQKSRQEGLIGFEDDNFASAIESLCDTLSNGAFTTAQVIRLNTFAKNIAQFPGSDFCPPMFEAALMAAFARAGFTLGDLNKLTSKLVSAKPGQRIVLTVKGKRTMHKDIEPSGPSLVVKQSKDR